MCEIKLVKKIDHEVCVWPIRAADTLIQKLQNSQTGLMPKVGLSGNHKNRCYKDQRKQIVHIFVPLKKMCPQNQRNRNEQRGKFGSQRQAPHTTEYNTPFPVAEAFPKGKDCQEPH